MKKQYTCRGFAYNEFTDLYGVTCSLQESSLATEPAIWLGCDDANPRVMVPGKGWTKIEMPDGYLANTRMHLGVEQVKELVKALKYWLKNGELK